MTETRTCMMIAKDMDKAKKALTKADNQLAAVQHQMALLDKKKKDAMADIGDLDQTLDKLKKEMEATLDG